MIDLKKNHEQTQRLAQISPIGVYTADAIKAYELQEKIASLGVTKVDTSLFDGLTSILVNYEQTITSFEQARMTELEKELNDIDAKIFALAKKIIEIREASKNLNNTELEVMLLDVANKLTGQQSKMYNEEQDGIAFILLPIENYNKYGFTVSMHLTKRDFDINDESSLINRTIASLKKKIISLNASIDNTAQEYDHYQKHTTLMDKLTHPIIHTHNKQFYNQQMKELVQEIKKTEEWLELYRTIRSRIKSLSEEVRNQYIEILDLGNTKGALKRKYAELDSQWYKYKDHKYTNLIPFETYINNYLTSYLARAEAEQIVRPFYEYLKQNNINSALGDDKEGFDLAKHVDLHPFERSILAIANSDYFEKEQKQDKLNVIIPANEDDDDDDDDINACYGRK